MDATHAPGAFSLYNPVRIRFGRGRAAELPSLRGERPLLVTTAGSVERLRLRGLVDAETRLCVAPNPGAGAVEEGAALAVERRADVVVGLGGGSALDCAKCIAVLAGNGDSLKALADRAAAGETIRRRVGLVQVPTTAGTGSEVTRWASLWTADGRKWSFDHAQAYADTALVDPQLCESMRPRLTAATGLDAMAHAIESVWGAAATPPTTAYALQALRLLREHLVEAVRAPTPAARDAVSLAALLAGLALSNSRSAAAHALSYALTGSYGLEHGLAVGITCRALLRRHAVECEAVVGELLAATSCASVAELEGFIESVFAAAGLRASLTALGIPASALGDIAAAATAADRMSNSRIRLDEDALVGALRDVA